MLNTLELSLVALCGSPVEVVDDDAPEDSGEANVSIVFGNGTALGARYWRLIRKDFVISSFDHGQKYGLPEALDAKR